MQELKKAPTNSEGQRAIDIEPTRQLTICVNNSGTIENTTLEKVTGTWGRIVDEILTTNAAAVTRAEYLNLHEGDRDQKQKAARIKAQAGYFLCGTCDPLKRAERNVKAHSLLPLDIDGVTSQGWETVRQRLEALGVNYLWYATASDTQESRRIRVIVPLARDIEHQPGTGKKSVFAEHVKRLATFLGVATDAAACNPAQAMYRPIAFNPPAGAVQKTGVDMPECAVRRDRPFLDPDSLPPLVQSDPTPPPAKPATSKPGAPGVSHWDGLRDWFNGNYPGGAVIDAFLSDVYEAGKGSGDRWTYKDGTTTNGLVLYEDGKFYSNHSTDPAATGHSKTPFQLVCSHRFGDGTEAYKACCEWVQTLPGAPQPPAGTGADSGVFPAARGSEVGWHEKAPQKAPRWQWAPVGDELTARLDMLQNSSFTGTLEFWSGKAIKNTEFKPLEWIVPGLIPVGYSMLVAPPKTGKSYMALDIAMGCADGGTVLGGGHADAGIRVKQRPVLYLSLEDSPRRVQQRGNEIRPFGNWDMLTVATFNPFGDGVTQESAVNDIGVWCNRVAGDTSPLIIVDTLAKAGSQRRTKSSNPYSDDYEQGAAWQQLAQKFDAALLVVHHTNKAGNRMENIDVIDMASGSYGVTGACDTVLGISRKRGENTGVLSMTSREAPEGSWALKREQGGAWQLDGDSLKAAAERLEAIREEQELQGRHGDTHRDVVEYVNSLEPGSTVRAADVADALGKAKKTVANRLRVLAESGLIERVNLGEYGPIRPVKGLGEN